MVKVEFLSSLSKLPSLSPFNFALVLNRRSKQAHGHKVNFEFVSIFFSSMIISKNSQTAYLDCLSSMRMCGSVTLMHLCNAWFFCKTVT